ncbi:hypothetical protein TNCV_4925951 [Trichonephila clavipes]|nr:hypothetical protein TNCV_4925951 [Trichonephila clavipes]
MVRKANDRRTSRPCHDELHGPQSDYVRQDRLDFCTTYGDTTDLHLHNLVMELDWVDILQPPALVVSAATTHKNFGPTDLTSMYSVCIRRVLYGIGHRSQAFRSGNRCSIYYPRPYNALFEINLRFYEY